MSTRETHPSGSTLRSPGSSAGFTLIELMIVVVIVAVLATVATIAYNRYIIHTRIADAERLLNVIKIQQEIYFQRHNSYVSAPFHPAVHVTFQARPWTPAPTAWVPLAVPDPGSGGTYFSFLTRGFAASSGGDAITARLGLTHQVPTFYIIARGDVDGKAATQPMQMIIGSQSAKMMVLNAGQ